MPRTVDDLLAEARSTLERVTAQQARDELADGALLVDVRTSEQRAEPVDRPADPDRPERLDGGSIPPVNGATRRRPTR